MAGTEQRIKAFGPYEFDKERAYDRDYIAGRWSDIDLDEPGLSQACGVYIFCLRNAANFVPVYIGRTSSRAGFHKRVFSDDKFRDTIRYFQENRGVMTVILLAKRKPIQAGFAAIADDDLEFLETFCIMCAMRKNERLTNASKTRFSERLMIPGITGNFGQGHPTNSIQSLRNAFNLEGG